MEIWRPVSIPGFSLFVVASPRQKSEPENAAFAQVRTCTRNAIEKPYVQALLAALVYIIAGKLGQATANIRSSNLGPVWPAFGIALAAFLLYGYRVWPGVATGAFFIAVLSPVPHLAAVGQTLGSTVAALSGAFLLRRIDGFDPSLSRLRDAVGMIAIGGFGSAIISASIGTAALYITHVQAYAGIGPAWLIYWLGDATGVLLVTPLVFTLGGLKSRSWATIAELGALLALTTAACLIIFGDFPFYVVRLHVLAFAVLPFVIWAAIRVGVAGAALSVFLIAATATIETALGWGPFAQGTPFTNAVLLDVFFAVLSLTGLSLAAVIKEREQAQQAREQLVREQVDIGARLRLAAIVESSDDAIVGKDLAGTITDWNKSAEKLFGYSASEVCGKPITTIVPEELRKEEKEILRKLGNGEHIEHYETVRITKDGKRIDVSLTLSPVRDYSGNVVSACSILRDITERKLAEEALSTVSQKLIEAQEQEGSRLARELHDDINQRLALLSVQLDNLKPEEARKRIDELSGDIQALSHRLHSPRLDYLGLESAASGLCKELSNRQGVEINFRSESIPRELPQEISLCLFRVLQEALQNAVKHSGSPQLEVLLRTGSNDIELTVQDSGVGFRPEQAIKGRGLGLTSMQERLRLVQGELLIDSKPQHGTTIHARVLLA